MNRRIDKINHAKEIYKNKKDNKDGNNLFIDDLIDLIEKENIENVKQVFKQEIKVFDRSKFLNNFSECNKDKLRNYYVWIALTSYDLDELDNLVVVVGKAEFSKKPRTNFGDLFKDYRFWGNVTQELILNLVCSNEEMDNLIRIEGELNSFISRAIVLSLDVTSKSEASKVETEVGRFLIKKGVQIINEASHEY